MVPRRARALVQARQLRRRHARGVDRVRAWPNRFGKKTDALVEFVDIYPTLAELCGLSGPAGVEGASFAPLLDAPQRTWKKAVFSQYPRNIPGVGPCMSYSIRTHRYRLVEWAVPAKSFVEYELYDHQTDPRENVNLAKRPEHTGTVRELAARLREGWQAVQP